MQSLDPATSPTVARGLDFSFGYWRLYAHTAPVQMVNIHFAKLPSHPPSAKNLNCLPVVGKGPLCIVSHPLQEPISTFEVGRSIMRYALTSYRRYYVEFRGTFEQYLQGLGRKRRCELRRKMRKFAPNGAPDFREYKSRGEIREFYDFAIRVSRQSFQKRIGYGLPEDSVFLAQLLRVAEEDRVRGYLLFYDERPAAFLLCYANDTWLTAEICGYDPSLRAFSPGNALLGSVLERLFQNQEFTCFDLGTGDAEYKAFFATDSVTCADVYYFQRSLKNVALVILHRATIVLWQSVISVLNAMRLKDKLKKLARNGWKRPEPATFR